MLGTFPSSDRFERVRRIGQGGMGVVYEAYDRERGGPVALKTLRHRAAGDSVLLFKTEFRALQDIVHPNLVTLHELFCNDAGHWYFTMDLVPGVDVLEHVRPSSTPWIERGAPSSDPWLEATANTQLDLEPRTLPASRLDVERLRSSLRQLSAGLAALHAAGKVHCDIKPSNILVTPDGRLVLLDFGLIMGVDTNRPDVAGTAAYLAPEQFDGGRIAPSADWYAVGVFLYQALTGKLPFDGSALDIREDKRAREPPPPSQLVPTVPADLDALCSELLRRDVEGRPRQHEVLRRLGADRAMEAGRIRAELARPPFVGRGAELRAIEAAFAAVKSGWPQSLLVHGESGVGKSELVRQFSSRASTQALVLAGRCYERESVPYKALDGVMDALSEFVAKLDAAEALTFGLSDADVLFDAFPVLGRIERRLVVPSAAARTAATPAEMRVRLFAAVRQLFHKVAAKRPLVVIIDDLQWADPDSFAMLQAVLQRPGAPAMLLVATTRSVAHAPQLPSVQNLTLEPLPQPAAEELARTLLLQLRVSGLDARVVAKEAGGHPLYIAELLRHFHGAPTTTQTLPRLDEVLSQRAERLHPAARNLIELLAVAGGPIAKRVAAVAAELGYPAFVDCARQLSSDHLVKSEGQRGSDAIEPYHDRVREAVLASLPAARRRQCHERLARALEASDSVDAETLSMHWRGAGDWTRAAELAVRAAADAERALAHDRAARLYRSAIDLGAGGRDVVERLGVALVNAGHGAEAAAAFQRAAAMAAPAERARLQEQAAFQLLRCGQIDAGKAALAPSLELHGVPLPKNAFEAIAIIALQTGKRALFHPRFGFTPKREGELAPELITKLDVCFQTMCGLLMVDQILGVAFHARGMNLALEAGEPMRLGRALLFEALKLGVTDGPEPQIDALFKRAEAINADVGDDYVTSMMEANRGTIAFLQGRFVTALEMLDRAIALLRKHCVGVTWEIDSCELNRRWTLCHLGRLRELSLEVENTIETARASGDRFAQVGAQSGYPNLVWLAKDDVEGARARASEAAALWAQKGFHLQHMFDLFARVHISLYEGDARLAYTTLENSWPALVRSKLLVVQTNRVLMNELRGRTALAMAAICDGDARRTHLRTVDKTIASLDKERRLWPQASARFLSAQADWLRGRTEVALATLITAERMFEEQQMKLYENAARWLRGVLLRDRGEPLVERARAALAGEDVQAPAKLVRLFAPALPA